MYTTIYKSSLSTGFRTLLDLRTGGGEPFTIDVETKGPILPWDELTGEELGGTKLSW